jgi:mono/diheme cytochrome c family protein
MAFTWRGLLGLVLLFFIAASSMLALQSQGRTVADGVYTAQQATRGQTIYNARCASCHANNLAGRTGPPLVGDDFLNAWSAQPLLDLANKIIRTMPRNENVKLTPEETADLVAYLLQVGKFPAGRSDLVMNESALKQVTFPQRATPAPAQAASVSALPSSGNVAQVMRGILFPSSNILFTTQSVDPGAKKPVEVAVGTGGFDWLTWGGGVYAAWDIVDYAAIAVAESAQLMLTPGRRCENGRPVPVSDPDWIKFTMELAEAGKASYRASQTRIQDKVADSTNQLNDSCMHCHQVFRGRTHCAKP